MSHTATTRWLGVKGPRRQASRAVTRGAAVLMRTALPLPLRLLLLLPLLLLSSCGLFRPSAERQCRKAQGLITKAVRICPEAAQLRTDTLTIQLPGDSSDGAGLWTDADMDSVYAACEQIREALDAERQLMEITNGVASRIVRRQHMTIDSLRKTYTTLPTGEGRGGVLPRLRRSLCQWPDILDSTDLHILRIRYSPSGPLYTIIDRPRTAQAITTTQAINNGPVDVQAGANGWLIALTALGWLLAVVLLLHFLSERGMRERLQEQLQKLKK